METQGYKGIRCLKLTIYSISIFQLVIAMLMVIGAAAIKILFRQYTFTTWYSSLHNLPNLWIATGIFLAGFSAFGLYAMYKKSTKLMNLYAVSLTLIFILQVASAITGFTLLPQTDRIAGSVIDSLMGQYLHNYRYSSAMNWIQKNYQCCGNDGPFDWHDITNDIPKSCCVFDSENDCIGTNKAGCHSFLHDMASRNFLLIASSALVFGILQIIGIICAVKMASKIRQCKTERDVQKWATFTDPTLENPFDEKIRAEELRDGDINYM